MLKNNVLSSGFMPEEDFFMDGTHYSQWDTLFSFFASRDMALES